MDVLRDYRDVLNGLTDDVYAALHKYLLSKHLQLRPYGFIMNSALVDALPADRWSRSMRQEMRPWLQVTRTEFVSVCSAFLALRPHRSNRLSSELKLRL